MQVPVFYRPEMSAKTITYSPSPSKPARVVKDWLQREMPIDIVEFQPVTNEVIARTHDPYHVAEVMALRSQNGFENHDPAVRDSLPYTIGSIVEATKYVAAGPRNKPLVACSPTSGFHHAGFDTSKWYCTFNGLVIAAREVIRDGLAEKVGILDFDYHYGDGTQELIEMHGMRDVLWHFSSGEHYSLPSHADDLLRNLPEIVRNAKTFGCDVLIYQAGADQHIRDPLGGMLTPAQLRSRDSIVFSRCKDIGMPLVWNLAGGYMSPFEMVLTVHRNTLKECIRAYE